MSTYNGLDVLLHLGSVRQAELNRDERDRLQDERKKKRAAQKKKREAEKEKREAEKKRLAEKKRKRCERERKAFLRDAKKRLKDGSKRLTKNHHIALLHEQGIDIDANKSAKEVASLYALETSSRGKRRRRSRN